MYQPFQFFMPAQIFFGAGSLDNLGSAPLPGAKALIVIGGTSVKRLGYLDRVQALLKKQGVESVVFDKVQPNPVVEHVMEASSLARETGCDFVIGLGGGSSMDSAKSIAVMAANPGTYWDYIQGGSGKGLPIPCKPLPIVCITTTAGTGTEADPWTVITKEDTQEKIGFGFRGTFPTMSIVDPELMLSVPPKLTAYQGFDALFHAVEGYMATIASPMGDMFALQAIEYIAKYLPRAVNNGDDLEARAYVALANTYSGFVETISCCTSEHSIEHALSAFHPSLPHGAGLIMISCTSFLMSHSMSLSPGSVWLHPYLSERETINPWASAAALNTLLWYALELPLQSWAWSTSALYWWHISCRRVAVTFSIGLSSVPAAMLISRRSCPLTLHAE